MPQNIVADVDGNQTGRSTPQAHASFSRSFSDSADFIAINGEEKKFQKCDVTKLRRLKGREHARISCAFMTKTIIVIMNRKTSFDFGVASCCCGRQIAVCFRSHCVCGAI